MARCVTDLALLAEALLNDRAALSPHGSDGEPSRFVVPGGLFADRAEQVMTNAIDGMRNLVPPNSFERCDWPALAADLPRRLRAILATEAAAYHGDRFRRQPDDYPTKIRELIEEGLQVIPDDYRAALDHRESFKRVVDASLFSEGAQVLTPATLGPAPDRSTTGDGLFNGPWSYAGYPTVSLPIGRAENGLPLAVQIVGKGRQDLPDLFASAGWLEQRIGFDMRLPPTPDELAAREM